MTDRQPAPEELGGDPACWLHWLCPECGAMPDSLGDETCPRCGARGDAGGEGDE